MLEELKENLARLKGQYTHIQLKLKEEKALFLEAEDQLEAALEGQKIIQDLVQTIQEKVHTKIASTVTQCLEAIQDEPYEFKIIFEKKRGKTEARLMFLKDGNEISPMSGSGGGILDVAAFALRVAHLVLTQPARRRLLILDEPFHFLHGYEERAQQMIMALSKKLGIQFIISTQIPELQIGKVIQL